MKPRTVILLAAIVLVSACVGNENAPGSSRPAGTATLENIYWKIMTISGTRVVVPRNQREPHMVLHSDTDRVTAFGGCNQMTGTFQIEGEKLTLSRMASTMMACEQGMEQEQALHDALSRVARWRVDGSTLELLDIGGKVVVTFEAKSVPGEKSLS